MSLYCPGFVSFVIVLSPAPVPPRYDVKHVVAAFNNIKAKRFARENEERQREALMATSFTTNDQARSKGVCLEG